MAAPHTASLLLLACLAAPGLAVRDTAVVENIPSSNNSALVEAKHQKQRLFNWCSDWCMSCPGTGVDWKVHRAQATSKKLALFAAGAGAVALIAMTGGLAGAAGAMFMGAAAAMGAGTSLVIGAGAIGAAHLLTNTEDRACPEVTFEEKLPENAGLVASTKHNFLKIFNKSPHKEQTFKLVDVEYMELMLQLKDQNGELLMKGDRSEMDADERIKAAVGCSYMTFDDKLWLQKKQEETQTIIPEAEQDKMKAGIVEQCGKWLCAGAAEKAHKPTPIIGTCGGRTSIMKSLWR